MEGADPLRVGLHIADFILCEKPDLHPVGLTPCFEFPENSHVVVGLRHDEDAAAPYRHTSLRAELVQLTISLHAVLGFQGAGLEVVSGMYDAGVPTTLVHRRTGFLLENKDVQSLLRQMERGADSHSAGTDHDDLNFRHAALPRPTTPQSGIHVSFLSATSADCVRAEGRPVPWGKPKW